jgi:hypothetical protein
MASLVDATFLHRSTPALLAIRGGAASEYGLQCEAVKSRIIEKANEAVRLAFELRRENEHS